MSILSATDLHKSYAERAILAGVSVAIAEGERIGLVGQNGSGKSTLSRILAGLESPDRGTVVTRRGLRVAYLEQEPRLDPDLSAHEVVLAGLSSWSAALERHRAATAAIAAAGGELDALLAEQADAAADVERLGGWELQHEADAMLGHLGVERPEAAVGQRSGGERRRIALARLLVSRPDIAILDEPTNHLDVDTIEWLERYLAESFAGALLLVTHDRYLLDRVVTRTLELDAGCLYSYDGGWQRYLTAKAERQAHAERVDANRRNLLRRELEWLERQPKARGTKQKARIGRAEAALAQTGPKRQGTARIRMDGARSGRTVLDVDGLVLELGGRRLVDGLELSLGKGERIGIVGPNGSGKTTLLRALLGELEPEAGSITVGKNARVAYLDQGRGGLDDDATVSDAVSGGASTIRLGEQEISTRSYLERFLFDSSAQRQRVGTLSGGERARVALARVLRDGANLVMLDEPTNDLDVTTLAALEEALTEFGGTVLVVTHDRWFLDRIATSILAFDSGADGGPDLVHVVGTYQDYMRYRQQRDRQRAEDARTEATQAARRAPAAKAPPPAAKAKAPRGLTYGERLELGGLLAKVEAAEDVVTELERELQTPAFFERDHVAQAKFLAELEQARAEAEALVERWADLESRKDD